MNKPQQQEMLGKLAEVCELSPDVRFGQLLANLAFLSEDRFGKSLWEVEDDQLLALLEGHRRDLSQRRSSVA